MSKENIYWECTCGEGFELTPEEAESGDKRCPFCGARLGGLDSEPRKITGPEETQMINVREMARMAQEGVDVSISGEWDTTKVPAKKRD
ncbi:hypothetical protein ACFL2Q_06005 [Thermodesulfobacteriota bacterium]